MPDCTETRGRPDRAARRRRRPGAVSHIQAHQKRWEVTENPVSREHRFGFDGRQRVNQESLLGARNLDVTCIRQMNAMASMAQQGRSLKRLTDHRSGGRRAKRLGDMESSSTCTSRTTRGSAAHKPWLNSHGISFQKRPGGRFAPEQGASPPDSLSRNCKYNRSGLLPGRSIGSDPNHDYRAPIQVDISPCPQQNAGSISHPGILLAWCVVRDQYPGNRRGAYCDRAVFSHQSPRRRTAVGCRDRPSASRALRRATGWLSRAAGAARAVGRTRTSRPAGRCCPLWR
jgi:hypothetical protein